MSEWVFIEREPSAGKERRAVPGTTIGRAGCDIDLPDPELSRGHAKIRELNAGPAIEDLDSTNGTFVNGERVRGVCALAAGDTVTMGSTVWTLQAPSGDPERAGAAAQLTATRAVAAEPSPSGNPAPVTTPGGGRRGDVPAPDAAPSAIRRVVPPPGGAQAFSPAAPPPSHGSRATRVGATVAAYVATALVAAGVVAYYVTKPFE